jgi:hypothetical protein
MELPMPDSTIPARPEISPAVSPHWITAVARLLTNFPVERTLNEPVPHWKASPIDQA